MSWSSMACTRRPVSVTETRLDVRFSLDGSSAVVQSNDQPISVSVSVRYAPRPCCWATRDLLQNKHQVKNTHERHRDKYS